MEVKKKILIFHTALAPYRVDFFNAIDKEFDASFYFSLINVPSQKFDQEAIKRKCTFNSKYLLNGIDLFGYLIRTGVIRTIKHEKPDIILCNEYGPVTINVFLYKILFKKKFHFYTISDDSIDVSKSRKGLRAFLRTVISKNIEGVIFTSEKVSDWYRKNISTKPKTLELPIIHNDNVFREELSQSLDSANNNIKKYNLQGKKVLLYVGRLVTVKNLSFLLKVVAKIKSTDWVLVFVGDGIMMDSLKAQVQELNITDKIIFVGRKEGSELASWYTFAQIFVLPSIYEPFGAVVNEALLGGCKVLCSDIAGASSLINNDNGRIFSPYNEEGLLSNIEEMLVKVVPTVTLIHDIRENRMPFTFKEKVDTLMMNL
jgi:glycosyltransferase involved in cell wall biosynthesis